MFSGIYAETNGKFTHKIMFEGVLLLPIGGVVSWGHLGQSAYNTAYTILLHSLGDRKKAERLAHRFKREIISDLYFNCSWSISQEEIEKWVNGGHINNISFSDSSKVLSH